MKKIKMKLAAFSLVLALVLSLGLSGCISFPSSAPIPTVTITKTITGDNSTPNALNPTWTPPTSSTGLTLPGLADVVAAAKPSVVAITTEVVALDFFNRQFTQEGAGSGWIIDSSGYIVTNNHVVEGAQSITATLDDGRSFNVDTKNVFTDALNDLAVLKIDAQNLPALKVGDSSEIRVGDWVIAVGNALGQGIRATEGIISRKGVAIPVDQNQTLYDLIETTAAINPGNSGGPLVNLAGQVIGITSAKIAQIGVEGMGYAISTDTATPIIQQLINQGYIVRPWLGASMSTVNQFVALRNNLGITKGVLIYEVGPGTPAERAGLKAGDVIVGFGGKEVAAVEELTRILYSSQIGQPIEVTYYRNRSQNTTQVTPVESPRP